ncbi:hypothetical protein KZ686_24465 [Cupriavidus cauae]|uniref:hypothetical protein n=1 Tax=Cupriavidus cauae TaxID=2608999 RepID=UPI002244DEB5|nr:hypothetical protein [Cupriavidus cauae]UZN51457.1 hypothetical protein KZ686_24465 [Cupriavidus cauae]
MKTAEESNHSLVAGVSNSVVPDPADAIAAFRLWRVETAVDAIAATTQCGGQVLSDSR